VTIGLPLWVLSGIMLWLLMQSPKASKMLTIVVAIIFGAAASSTVFSIIQAFQTIFAHKG